MYKFICLNVIDQEDGISFKINSIKQTKKENNIEHKLDAALKAITKTSDRYKKQIKLTKEL